jgi:regulatory protein YycH of two-component signal transduction system YycFG
MENTYITDPKFSQISRQTIPTSKNTFFPKKPKKLKHKKTTTKQIKQPYSIFKALLFVKKSKH